MSKMYDASKLMRLIVPQAFNLGLFRAGRGNTSRFRGLGRIRPWKPPIDGNEALLLVTVFWTTIL